MPFDPRGYPGYLFDLDGTLIDTAPDIGAAVNHALEQFGYEPVPESTIRHWVGLGGRHCIEQAVAATQIDPGGPAAADGAITSRGPASSALVDRMLAVFLDHYRAHIADSSLPYPGVVDALEALSKRQAKLAVVTNKRYELTIELLAELKLADWFDTIVGGDTAAKPKPAADPILLACETIGLKPEEILFVGDSVTDVKSARAAGCPVVCVPEGYNQGIPPDQLGADAIVNALTELI